MPAFADSRRVDEDQHALPQASRNGRGTYLPFFGQSHILGFYDPPRSVVAELLEPPCSWILPVSGPSTTFAFDYYPPCAGSEPASVGRDTEVALVTPSSGDDKVA